MANSASHSCLPYPIKNARFTVQVPYLDADGDPTDPTTPDTEISKDGGAFADCTEEVTTVTGSNGVGYITLTGAETNCSMVALCAKVASGPKATIGELYPRVLAVVGSGTLSAGSAGGGTLGTILAYDVCGCFIRTTGGTGGGGTGGASNQARKIITYTTSTGAFTVAPDWETTPSTDTTYDVLLPEGVSLGMLRALNPATPGRTAVVDASGLIDANMVKVGPTGSGTAQTAGDLKALIDAVDNFIDTEIADIQSRLPAALGANGNIKADVRDYNGSAGTFSSGRPEVKLGNVAHGGAAASLTMATLQADDIVVTNDLLVTGDGTFANNLAVGAQILVTTGSQLGTVTTASDSVVRGCQDSSGVTTLLSRIPSGIFTGMTSLAQWLGLIAGKQTPNSTALTEIKDTGAGSGTYDATTDSLEAIKDAGSAGLDAAGVRAAIGLASANLDTQLGDLPTAAENADAVWDEATSGHTTSGTFGEQLKTDVDAILADTNELQTDWANGGRLDLILDTAAAGGGGGGANQGYAPGSTLNFKFTTVDTSGAPVAPVSLAVSCYKDSSTTQTTNGITTTSGFDSVTGLINVTVDTSADGTFYAAGSTFQLVVTTGTADSVSLVGQVVGDFVLQDPLDVPTAAENATALKQTALSGAVAAQGAAPTFEQALMLVHQYLQNRGISGVTETVYAPDGTTPLATITLNSATAPTAAQRAT